MDSLDVGVTLRSFSAQQKVFNRFILQRLLGRGGMGVVWLAKDTELDRDVALKFLPEIVALDPVSVAELKKETRRNLDLTHPHIVRIYDFVQDARTAAISMEFVDGPSLSALRAERPAGIFPLAELRPWLGQLVDGLAYAHERAKVVHRDLKPANLMVTTAGDLKITDFGIATSISDSVSRISGRSTSGTAVYMSPQQMMGERAAPTDDLYAIGATLYELLTGKPPFHAGNVIAQVTNKIPPSIAERRAELGHTHLEPVPAAWESAIARCLAKDPKDRPQSARELLAEIDGLSRTSGPAAAITPAVPAIGAAPHSSPSPSAPAAARSRKAPLVAGLVGLVVVAAAVVAFLSRDEKPTAPGQKGESSPVVLASAEKSPAEQPAQEDAGEPAREEANTLPAESRPNRSQTPELPTLPLVATGSLLVSSEPDDAEVTWDTITRRTPTQFQNVPAGRVALQFAKSGYQPARLEIDLKPGESLTVPAVKLAPLTYPVRLEATTPGVSFTLASDTEAARRPLPASLDLPAGRHVIRFFRPGYGEKSEAVQVTAQGLTVSANLRGGSLRVESVPAGASVLLDGRERGHTPLVLEDLPSGPHQVELRLAEHLAKTFSFEAVLGASDSRSTELEMDPEVAYFKALQGYWAAGLNGLRFSGASGDATYRAGANFVKGRNFPMKLLRFDAASQTGVFRPDDPKLPTFEIVLRGGVAVLRWAANDRGKYYDVPMSRCSEDYFNKL